MVVVYTGPKGLMPEHLHFQCDCAQRSAFLIARRTGIDSQEFANPSDAGISAITAVAARATNTVECNESSGNTEILEACSIADNNFEQAAALRDVTADMSENASSFAALARQLRQQQKTV